MLRARLSRHEAGGTRAGPRARRLPRGAARDRHRASAGLRSSRRVAAVALVLVPDRERRPCFVPTRRASQAETGTPVRGPCREGASRGHDLGGKPGMDGEARSSGEANRATAWSSSHRRLAERKVRSKTMTCAVGRISSTPLDEAAWAWRFLSRKAAIARVRLPERHRVLYEDAGVRRANAFEENARRLLGDRNAAQV